jgi:hypothetical protein
MSKLLHGLLYITAEFVDVYARVNQSSFLQVLSPQLLLFLALRMAPQHKQKVHKTNFATVPAKVPAQPSPAQPSRLPLSPHSCRICDRAYVTASALEQHYRDTPVHPKCTRCNVGFADNAAIQAVSSNLMRMHSRRLTPDKHVISTHRPIICNICKGIQVYAEDVARHYRISTNHPSCTVCDLGFENKEAFDEVRQTPYLLAYSSRKLKLMSHLFIGTQHNNTTHPQFRCKICNIPFGSAALLDAHYSESPRHPRCPECRLSFEDNLALVKV